MEIGIPSRFACLNIEDDDFTSNQQESKPKEPKKKVKKPVAEPPKLTNNKKSDKPAPTKKPDKQAVPAAVNKKGNKKKQTQQWEDWKQKDVELENGVYEEDLRNAILLSKLDLELGKESNCSPTVNGNIKPEKKKSKKSVTVTLDKFLNLDGNKHSNYKEVTITTKCLVEEKDDDFFNSVDKETKSELKKEQVNTKRKKREANINQVISLAHYQEKYEAEHQLRLEAESQLKDLKAELLDANIKIKTFCKLISHGQMKDKTTILLENQQLTAVKNDLTESVANLHAALEKERSKVASLTASQNNGKQKKRKGN